VTKCYNVLAILNETGRIQEYTTDGSLVREISLDSSINHPQHCVQLSTGNFVVSHGGGQHRVCIVDTSGHIIQSYGGSGTGLLSNPRQLAVDKHDNVLVADRGHDRFQLLSPALTYLGDVVIPGYQLKHPYAVHFDELNQRLYIGEVTGKRIFVLHVDSST